MDHKDLISELSQKELSSLTERSDFQGLQHLFGHLLLIGLSGVYVATGLPGWQLALIFYGICLIFLFTLLHETVHDTPFRSVWLNRTIGGAIGFFLLIPSIWFRYFHLAHHRHTHDPEKDPELESPKPESLLAYLAYLSGVPLWWSLAKSLLVNCIGNRRPDYVPKRAHNKVVLEARITVGIYILIAVLGTNFRLEVLIWFWMLPVLLGQPFLRAYLLAEHSDLPHVPNMLENTRTVFTNPLVRFIAWNMPYHTEHHSLPNVPFHQLPRLNRVMKDHLKHVENGYVPYHRSKIRRLVS